jgi:hypothetical protein
MKFGNVIYDDQIVKHEEVSYLNYIKNDTYDDNLPTYIVGWSFLNEKYPDLPNNTIQKSEIIKNKLYWGYSFDENKIEHHNGLDFFADHVFNYYFNSYEFKTIDPIFHNIKESNDILKYITHIESLYVYKKNILYLLINKKVYIINLSQYDFFDLKATELKDHIIKSSLKYTDDIDGDLYVEYRKSYNSDHFLKRYMPIVLSK